MDAVHEADNLADHFGRPGERVGVLVTTDLFDDAGPGTLRSADGQGCSAGRAGYSAGRMRWDRLVGIMGYLMEA